MSLTLQDVLAIQEADRLRRREADKRFASNNKDKVNEKQRVYKRNNKLKAIEYLGGKCFDCSGVFVVDVYDFHHRDPNEKEINGNMLVRYSWERAKEELDKCDLLCANCHRTRHYKERKCNEESS